MMWWRPELDDGFDDEVATTPDAFKCPITQERFLDPVVAADGHTYERAAIERWLSGRHCEQPFVASNCMVPSAQPSLDCRPLVGTSLKGARLWLSPLTGLPLLTRELRPNYALRKAIDEFAPEEDISRKRRRTSAHTGCFAEPQRGCARGMVVATLSIVTCCLILGVMCFIAPRVHVVVKPPQPAASWWQSATSTGSSDSSSSSLFLPIPLWYGANNAAPASAPSQASVSSSSIYAYRSLEPVPDATATTNGWHKLRSRYTAKMHNGTSAWPGSLLLLAGLVLCGTGLTVHDDQVALALVFAGAPLACVSFVVGLACASGGDSESALTLSRCLLLIGFVFCGTGVYLTRAADRLEEEDRLEVEASARTRQLQSRSTEI